MELNARGVSRRYFRQGKGRNFFFAVEETDLAVPAGQLTEITGRSGSGKSTLLYMLAGLLTPTAGRVLWDGTDVYALPDAERSVLRNGCIGVIPQGQTGLSSMTVLENVLLPGLIYGLSAKRADAEALLERVGILQLKSAYPHELSGGEMRRLAIARALILHPSVVLADEPTGDLDEENTAIVLQLLRSVAHKDGAAVLLVTHEKEAEAYADAVYTMAAGTLTAVKK